MQCNDGLSGAWATLYDGDLIQWASDDRILIRSDGGQYVRHAARSRRMHSRGTSRSLRLRPRKQGNVIGVEELVINVRNFRRWDPGTSGDPPALAQAQGFLGRRLVERCGLRRTPVHEDNFAVGVSQTYPAHMVACSFSEGDPTKTYP